MFDPHKRPLFFLFALSSNYDQEISINYDCLIKTPPFLNHTQLLPDEFVYALPIPVFLHCHPARDILGHELRLWEFVTSFTPG